MVNEFDTAALPQYRTISMGAIAALLAGLAAPLALVNVILLAVPLGGIFLAAGALRSIKRNQEITSGAWLARAGLFLSVFMLAFVPMRIVLRNQEMRGNAVALGDKVFELVREGRLYDVHHLSTRTFVGRDPSRSLAEYYAESPKLPEIYLRFIEDESVKKLTDLNGEFTARLAGVDAFSGDSDVDGFVLRYRVQSKHQATQPPFTIWLTVDRRIDDKSHEPIWWFRGIHTRDPASKK